MLRKINFLTAAFKLAIARFMQDENWVYSSHLAYSGLLALFPFLIFVTSLSSILGLSKFSDNIIDIVFETWPPDVAVPIAEEIRNVLTIPRGGVLTFSGLVTLYFASNGIEALRTSLNRANNITEKRSFLFCRIQSIFFVILAAIYLISVMVLLIGAPLFFNVNVVFLNHILYGRSFLSTLLITTGLIISYKYLPAIRLKTKDLIPGVLTVLVLWFAGSYIFALYLASYANYFSTYAGLTSIVVCMIFFYLLGVIFIFGADLNAAILMQRKKTIK